MYFIFNLLDCMITKFTKYTKEIENWIFFDQVVTIYVFAFTNREWNAHVWAAILFWCAKGKNKSSYHKKYISIYFHIEVTPVSYSLLLSGVRGVKISHLWHFCHVPFWKKAYGQQCFSQIKIWIIKKYFLFPKKNFDHLWIPTTDYLSLCITPC